MPGPLPLARVRVVNAGVNLPADAAAARLSQLGASVTKVEPPDGDPMSLVAPALYAELTAGQEIVRLDLKTEGGRDEHERLLGTADVLVTSNRPSALARMGLAQPGLARRHPRLVHVAIVGHPAPAQEQPGHDLTYAAPYGLLSPPAMPRTLMVDLGGAERTASTAIALLLAREQGTPAARYAEVALEDAATQLAMPLRHGLTAAGGILGGADPYYALYEAADGWIALGALEPRFRVRLVDELRLEPGSDAFAEALRARTAGEWERWAQERDIPLVALAPAPSLT